MKNPQKNRLQLEPAFDPYHVADKHIEGASYPYHPQKKEGRAFKRFVILCIVLFTLSLLAFAFYYLNKKYDFIVLRPKIGGATANPSFNFLQENEKKDQPEYRFYIPKNFTLAELKQALVHYNSKEYPQALSLLEHVVNSGATDDDKAQALIYMGIIGIERDNYELAREKFIQALRYNSKAIGAIVNLAILERRLNNFNAAREYALQANKLAPQDSQVHLLLGNILFENQNPDDAISTYQRALNGLSEDGIVYYNLALSHLQKKNYESALENFKKALEKSQSVDLILRANAQIAILYLKQNNYTLAADYMLKAVQLAPNNAKYLYNMGVISLYKKEPQSALNYFKSALQAGGVSPQVFRSLSQAFLNLRENDLAIQALQRALEINPNDYAALLALGDLQYKVGNMEAAAQSLRALINATPNDSNTQNALLKLAQVYADMEQYKLSIETVKRGLALGGNQSKGYLLLGRIYQKMKRPDMAIETWKKALYRQNEIQNKSIDGNGDEIDSRLSRLDEREIRLALGEYYRKEGLYEAAIKQYRALEDRNQEAPVQTEDAALYLAYAQTYMSSQETRFAIPFLKKVAEGRSSTLSQRRSALANLAECYSREYNSESFNKAIAYIQRALDLDPEAEDNGSLHLIEADILIKTKNNLNREKAIEILLAQTKSLNNSNVLAKTYDLLGLAYHENGEYKRALAAFDYALQLEPSFKQAFLHQKNSARAYELENKE